MCTYQLGKLKQPGSTVVFAIHLQIQIALQMNIFIDSEKSVSCGGRMLLELETNVFFGGGEQFSAGYERVEDACWSFSHTRNELPDTYKQGLCQKDCYSRSYLPPKWVLSCEGDPKGI